MSPNPRLLLIAYSMSKLAASLGVISKLILSGEVAFIVGATIPFCIDKPVKIASMYVAPNK